MRRTRFMWSGRACLIKTHLLAKDTFHTPSLFTRTRRNYDVFLSFRGGESNSYFIDHLYTTLDERGIRTFRDGPTQDRRKHIFRTAKFNRRGKGIDNCFVECRNTGSRLVLPVFFDVNPSDVRKQSGSYE
uniref:ADP-ribosyl cyclase/cyclic ADP-ribose hydrolase n=1 Tax=Nelumbo nucifera TaxID=4432 RepID=A0A822ZQF5_NELNU|nr:TPA_asm: hypothetical protein HUJ06_017030 [Nelumbo nucifera]